MQVRHFTAIYQEASFKAALSCPWSFASEPVRTNRLSGGDHRQAFLNCLCLMLLLVFSGIARADVAVTSQFKSLQLAHYLKQVEPPEELYTSTDRMPDNETWYQLDIKLEDLLHSDWLLVFRRVPYQRLDVFLPEKNGYILKTMGLQRAQPGSDPHTLKLNLAAGQTHRLYLRVQAPQPNRIAPELWPATHYTLNEYKSRGITTAFQTLLLLFLVAAGIVAIISRNPGYLVLTGHLLATNALLLMWQGDVFRYISWAGDPGHWVMLMTSVVIISALACYKNLGLLALYAPVADRVLVWMSLLAAGLLISFMVTGSRHDILMISAYGLLGLSAVFLAGVLLYCLQQGVTPVLLALPAMLVTMACLFLTTTLAGELRAVPSFTEIAVLNIQALIITGLYWTNRQQKNRQALAINSVTTHNDNRRIFDSALRKHLQPASTPMTEGDIRERILTTMDVVLPGKPTMLVVYDEKRWTIAGHYPRASRVLENQISSLESSLMDVIASGQDSSLALDNQKGVHYWALPLNSDNHHHTLLLLAPGRGRREALNWQRACDIASHARALFQASHQTRFWQLQASLDPLTGILNRRAFIREAENIVHRLTPANPGQCCLLFLDIDDFKQINDRFGHPAGDKVLSEVAQCCRNILRQNDLLGRYGGEEFVILLPDTSPWQGMQIAERIRRGIALYDGGPVPVTTSIGIAASNNGSSSLDQLLRDADQALYDAKEAGKNRIGRVPSCQDLRLSPQKASQ